MDNHSRSVDFVPQYVPPGADSAVDDIVGKTPFIGDAADRLDTAWLKDQVRPEPKMELPHTVFKAIFYIGAHKWTFRSGLRERLLMTVKERYQLTRQAFAHLVDMVSMNLDGRKLTLGDIRRLSDKAKERVFDNVERGGSKAAIKWLQPGSVGVPGAEGDVAEYWKRADCQHQEHIGAKQIASSGDAPLHLSERFGGCVSRPCVDKKFLPTLLDFEEVHNRPPQNGKNSWVVPTSPGALHFGTDNRLYRTGYFASKQV